MHGFVFAHDWPWLGAAAGAVLAAMLLRAALACGARCRRDPRWLAWLAVLLYLVHNVEEYGVDATGHRGAFPAALQHLVLPAGPVIPPAFFLAVNLALVWVALPSAAVLARRHPLVARAGFGVIAVNAVTHIGGMVAKGYNPGLVTALLLFVPAIVWIGREQWRAGTLPRAGLAAIVAAGIALHAVLMASLLAWAHGLIGVTALVLIQIGNAGMLLAIPWAAERRLHVLPANRDAA